MIDAEIILIVLTRKHVELTHTSISIQKLMVMEQTIDCIKTKFALILRNVVQSKLEELKWSHLIAQHKK